MKTLRPLLMAVLFASLCAAALTANAADTNTVKLKPYTLKTCVVSGDKLGEMVPRLSMLTKGVKSSSAARAASKTSRKTLPNTSS